jgi:hypothetical protein
MHWSSFFWGCGATVYAGVALYVAWAVLTCSSDALPERVISAFVFGIFWLPAVVVVLVAETVSVVLSEWKVGRDVKRVKRAVAETHVEKEPY